MFAHLGSLNLHIHVGKCRAMILVCVFATRFFIPTVPEIDSRSTRSMISYSEFCTCSNEATKLPHSCSVVGWKWSFTR